MIVIILLLNMLIMMPAQAESNKGKPMKKLTLLIDSEPVKLIPSPLIQKDRWLVPLESFCHLIFQSWLGPWAQASFDRPYSKYVQIYQNPQSIGSALSFPLLIG